ncbi:hypothetical protein AAFF_G00300150 [Aldrovandia affinis]|uniref:Uncharacterized protein n=1 Tax=Aldrovandia affinis TaxID=143900 RepID=A0AAD7SPV2_9TELE|nr:hypothetical protein AAFF_G00300150 [Aldrovandia affinis]
MGFQSEGLLKASRLLLLLVSPAAPSQTPAPASTAATPTESPFATSSRACPLCCTLQHMSDAQGSYLIPTGDRPNTSNSALCSLAAHKLFNTLNPSPTINYIQLPMS